MRSEEQSEPPFAGSKTTTGAQPWQRVLMGAAIVVALVLFARLNSSTPREESLFTPFDANRSTEAPAESMEVAARPLPDFSVPEQPAEKVQVGVFSRLQAAERLQQRLSELGLVPWVRKRPTDDGMLYVVLLGPYHDRQRKDSALATLEAHNLDYTQSE